MQATPLRHLTGAQCPMESLCVVELVYVDFLGLKNARPFQSQRQKMLLLGTQ